MPATQAIDTRLESMVLRFATSGEKHRLFQECVLVGSCVDARVAEPRDVDLLVITEDMTQTEALQRRRVIEKLIAGAMDHDKRTHFKLFTPEMLRDAAAYDAIRIFEFQQGGMELTSRGILRATVPIVSEKAFDNSITIQVCYTEILAYRHQTWATHLREKLVRRVARNVELARHLLSVPLDSAQLLARAVAHPAVKPLRSALALEDEERIRDALLNGYFRFFPHEEVNKIDAYTALEIA